MIMIRQNIALAQAQTAVAIQYLGRFVRTHSPSMYIRRNHTMLYLDDSRAVAVPGVVVVLLELKLRKVRCTEEATISTCLLYAAIPFVYGLFHQC